jgi:HEAT repeat protein
MAMRITLGEFGQGRRRVIIGVGAGLACLAVVGLIVWAVWPRVKGDTPEARQKSICRLADSGDWGAGDAIAKETDHPDVRVRQTAYVALSRFPDPKHRPTIMKGTADASPVIRAAAACALSSYKDAEAENKLMEMVLKDAEPAVRDAAGDSLMGMETPRSLVLVVQTAERHEDAQVRLRALQMLMAKFGLQYKGDDIENPDKFRRLLEYVKAVSAVQLAFTKAGVALERHPELIAMPGD